MKRWSIVLTLLVFLCWINFAASTAGAAAQKEEGPLMRIRGAVHYVPTLRTYGIWSDDDKAFHPIKRLSKEFCVDQMPVVVEARLREDIVAPQAYGKPIEVLKMTPAKKYIGSDDREAITLLLQRMQAFNDRDLAKLKEIDVMARSLSDEQFAAWNTGYGQYTLHYVEIGGPATTRLPVTTIKGVCLYSRVKENSMAINAGNAEYTLMEFSLMRIGGQWKFVSSGKYQAEDGSEIGDMIQRYLDAAQEKYGATDLAKWPG